jgi:hypothetical protein
LKRIKERFLQLNESGQCLSEMIMLLPLFMVLLAGVIAYMSANDWREGMSETVTIMRLGLVEHSRTAGTPAEGKSLSSQVNKLIERSRQLGQPKSRAQQQQPPRQSHLRYFSNCAELTNSVHDGMGFCTEDDDFLVAAPLPGQRLAPHSEALRKLLKLRPQYRERILPVFDSWEPFSPPERSNWDQRLSKSAQFRASHRAFVARLSSGGSERATPRYNLTRDCIFAAQGMICESDRGRSYSSVHDLFTWERKTSQSVQIAACAAEACAKTPHPAKCALDLAATAAFLATKEIEPNHCPIAVQTIKALHQAGTLVLKGAQSAEQIESLRRGVRVDTAGSMY